ncbi:MAG: hypothetical protein ACLSHG_06985 [Oscillospiraceae bacterium]
MPNSPRTDLAVEAEAIHRSAAAVTELPGVRAEETNRRGFSVTEVHVLDAAGENALCKPIGDYYTLRSTRCCGARTMRLKTRRRRSLSCCAACCR